MKKHLFTTAMLLISVLGLTFGEMNLYSQNIEYIKRSGEYLYGEGYGNTIAEADKQALESIISQISVSVSADQKSSSRAISSTDAFDEFSEFTSTVQTYSQATLTNTERLIISNEPDAHVIRWIKRSEIEKIFTSRIIKIKELASNALKAEKKGKADDALRNYYWALTLLKSVQYPNDVTYTDDEGASRLLTTWIPQRMKEVFDDLKVRVYKRDENLVELFFTYKDKPVNSLDYTYFDGQSWSNIYSAKDGVGVLELHPGHMNSSYQLKYEFEYRSQAHIDGEIEAVMNAVRSTAMRDAYVNIPAEPKPLQRPIDKPTNSSGNSSQVASIHINSSNTMAMETFTSTNEEIRSAPAYVQDPNPYQNITDSLFYAVKHKVAPSQELFTAEGWDIYQRLIRYGSARIVGEPQMKFLQNGEFVIGRGVQMSFSFKTGSRKSFVEDIVFTFDTDSKICNIAFGLGNTAVDDILHKGIWSEKARLGIMNFLENYKTAYCLKRLDYIRSIFDDEAVIIVGSVVKKSNTSMTDTPAQYSNTIIKRNRYTKDQYLKNLERCFNSNEFINIRFANNDVYKSGKGGELYGIQISQDYYSTNYGDKGYLFLMVDINDPENPIIKVRTWQPEKDPNFGLYSLGDF